MIDCLNIYMQPDDSGPTMEELIEKVKNMNNQLVWECILTT